MLLSFNTVRCRWPFHFAALQNDAGFSWRPQLVALIRIAILAMTLVWISMFGTIALSQTAPQQPHPPQETSSTPPQASAPNFEAARKLLQEGKYDEALSQLQALAAQDPKLPGLSHQLGAAYYKKGDFQKAVGYLKQATGENPKDSEAVQLLGLSGYFRDTQTKPSHCSKRFRPGIHWRMWTRLIFWVSRIFR